MSKNSFPTAEGLNLSLYLSSLLDSFVNWQHPKKMGDVFLHFHHSSPFTEDNLGKEIWRPAQAAKIDPNRPESVLRSHPRAARTSESEYLSRFFQNVNIYLYIYIIYIHIKKKKHQASSYKITSKSHQITKLPLEKSTSQHYQLPHCNILMKPSTLYPDVRFPKLSPGHGS